MHHTLQSLEDTQNLAKQIAQSLPAGSIVFLTGDLGAGKTTLIRSICACLGIPENQVTSPTYTIVHSYEGGTLPVYHLDLYRLSSVEDLDAFDPEELICEDGLTFVEWPQLFEEWSTEPPTVCIHLSHENEHTRHCDIQFTLD